MSILMRRKNSPGKIVHNVFQTLWQSSKSNATLLNCFFTFELLAYWLKQQQDLFICWICPKLVTRFTEAHYYESDILGIDELFPIGS